MTFKKSEKRQLTGTLTSHIMRHAVSQEACMITKDAFV